MLLRHPLSRGQAQALSDLLDISRRITTVIIDVSLGWGQLASLLQTPEPIRGTTELTSDIGDSQCG